jgi:hypothetical protein
VKRTDQSTPTPTSQLTIAASSDKIEISRKDSLQHLLTQTATPATRPFIHPITSPDGRGVLTEDAPPHHPWQHGLYTGLKKVGGVGFWEEGLRNKPTDGTFRPRPLQAPVVREQSVSWRVEAAWCAPDSQPLLTEVQDWRFSDHNDHYLLDLRWTLEAEVDIEIEQAAYGGLFLRMSYRPSLGGEVINSEGTRGASVEAAPARWVAVSMPVEGRDDPAGFVIMDHPNNPGHPVRWRVDGELGLCPSRCISGGWTLERGQHDHYFYRLVVFTGAPEPELIGDAWRVFARISP